METKTLVIVVAVVALVVAVVPFAPKLLGVFKSDEAIDAENLARIEAAVRAHVEATGAYPRDLAALVPQYLDAVPAMQDGRPFTYDVKTSKVSMPAKQTATPSAGASPVTDSFTGLSAQEELDF